MNLENLEELAQTVLADLKSYPTDNYLRSFVNLEAEFKNLMTVCCKVLKDHETLFAIALNQIERSHYSMNYYYIKSAIQTIEHLLKIIKIEKVSNEKSKVLKFFDSADEKIKQAGLCFQNGDYSSVFNSLNTAFELVIKDKLGIPTTITNINTSNIVDVLVKYKVEPYLYLTEAKKHVLTIDNKIKHQGYAPSKVDCINGIKAMEELVGKLRTTKIALTDEARNKIIEGL